MGIPRLGADIGHNQEIECLCFQSGKQDNLLGDFSIYSNRSFSFYTRIEGNISLETYIMFYP